ncbi:ferrous iron transport protein B [Aquimarina rhabdastrellae]
MTKNLKVALVGNPNTGKTSLFNILTGLNQQVGNYPGITVEKKEGSCKLTNEQKAKIIDLPGTYSLNASSVDENVAVEVLSNPNHSSYPDLAVVVCEVENLKRNLLLFTQVKDLQIPTILVINMTDQMSKRGITIDVPVLEEALQTKIVLTSTRKKTGIEELKKAILDYKKVDTEKSIDITTIDPVYFKEIQEAFPEQTIYRSWLMLTQEFGMRNVVANTIFKEKDRNSHKKLQHKETIKRYQFINNALKKAFTINKEKATGLRAKLDHILTHKVGGYIIFLLILLLIFQAIYDWSSYPMDWIDETFANLSEWTKGALPDGVFTSLIAEGIIPGIGGVVIFIPQIAFLFLFISILEESGYMSRVVFLMDKIMRRFGLSGKSVVPLISGTACAIPAVMAARNIENWKERLITILIVPFTTCSARLPVYLILIALIIPEGTIFGVFGLQSMTLMGLYLLGFVTAIAASWLLNKILKIENRSTFVVEMPDYKMPLPRNVIVTVIEKTKAFVLGAGKIILAISIILWVLASYGPGEKFDKAEEIVTTAYQNQVSQEELQEKIASYQLEHSYIGYMGKTIEPAVKPLGYDWKIGIALISSFAAREVFVGTLATIYSVGSEDEEKIKDRMASEVYASGQPVFTFASGMSLLLFYAFAMQCMSTIAIVKRETNSWKWATFQLVFMSGLAYIAALIAFQFLK